MNVLKMIFAVKERPWLYDVMHDMYRCAEMKKQSWEEVAKVSFEDFEDFDDLSEAERFERVHMTRRKWRYVTDYYKKENQNGIVRAKKYVYADALSFLDPIINNCRPKRKKPQKIKSAEPGDFNDYDHETTEMHVLQSEEDDSENFEPSPSPPPPEKRRKPVDPDPLLSHDLIVEAPSAKEDADRLFLLSMLPHMREMNEIQKLEFKIQILNKAKEIRQMKTEQ